MGHHSRSSSDISISSVSSSSSDHDVVVVEQVMTEKTTDVVVVEHSGAETTVTEETTVTTTTEDAIVLVRGDSSSSSSSLKKPASRRVVRKVERGAPHLLLREETVDENAGRVLKEYEFEEQVQVSYTGIREDVVEHIVAVPVMDTHEVRTHSPEHTRIIEVEKPYTVTKIIDVPQVEYVERLTEVPTPSGRTQKRLNYVTKKKVVPQERKVIVERPVERFVEVDDITYIDTEEIIETVEVPEYQDVIKIKEKRVPTIIEVPVHVVEETDCIESVDVLIPVGVEAETKVKYTVPTIVEKRHARGYPVYVPRFIETPTSSIHLTKEQRVSSNALIAQMKELEGSMIDGSKIVSACEIEKMGVAARDHQTCIQGHVQSSDLKKSLIDVFGRGASVESGKSHAGKAGKDKEEGYYGQSNVLGAWNGVSYDVKKHSRSSVSSRSGTSSIS